MGRVIIKRSFAREQIARLSGLPGYPTGNDDAIETLVDMLETAPSPGAARTFITCWLQDEIGSPTPAHIYRYFHPSKAAEQMTTGPLASSKNCPLCNGTGWQIIEGRNRTTAAKPCKCRQTALALTAE
jgi:hypothetical protein